MTSLSPTILYSRAILMPCISTEEIPSQGLCWGIPKDHLFVSKVNSSIVMMADKPESDPEMDRP